MSHWFSQSKNSTKTSAMDVDVKEDPQAKSSKVSFSFFTSARPRARAPPPTPESSVPDDETQLNSQDDISKQGADGTTNSAPPFLFPSSPSSQSNTLNSRSGLFLPNTPMANEAAGLTSEHLLKKQVLSQFISSSERRHDSSEKRLADYFGQMDGKQKDTVLELHRTQCAQSHQDFESALRLLKGTDSVVEAHAAELRSQMEKEDEQLKAFLLKVLNSGTGSDSGAGAPSGL